MSFDFTTAPDRRGTGSLKWDKYAGTDILPLWVADMDFLSPPCVREALARRVAHGVFGYTQPRAETIEATLAWLRDRHGATAEADWLVWFPGLVPALNVICRAFGASGDEAIALTPVYPPFLTAPAFSNLKGVSVPLALEGDRWRVDPVRLEAAFTPRTRLLIFCNPHNPIGRVFSEAEVAEVAELCARHGALFCSDEIHADLTFGPSRHFCALRMSGAAAARAITLMAPSKTFNTPGLACAFAVIPDPGIRRTVREAARGIITEINAMGYVACEAAFRDGEPWRQALLDTLRGNRDFLYEFTAREMPELRLRPMEATYLAWLDARGLDLEDPVGFFEKGGVGLFDGKLFGPGGEGFLRLNFGCPRPRLEEALRRMKTALDRR
ncbi:MAG: PatB family C-S lyase [Verrucomicrobiae bacterium]|nr:PatB family C-S lyase [Verrucomicrobiae bacterium]